MEPFTIVNLLDLDDVVSARVEGLEGRFGRAQLDSRDLGVSHWRYAPGLRASTGHRHGEQEEAYIVVPGRGRPCSTARYTSSASGTSCAVAPPVIRAFAAGPEGMDIIAIGGPKPEGQRRRDGRRRLAGLTSARQTSRPAPLVRRRSGGQADPGVPLPPTGYNYLLGQLAVASPVANNPTVVDAARRREDDAVCLQPPPPRPTTARSATLPSSRSATSTTTCASGTTTAERRASARPSRSAASPAARPSPGAATCSTHQQKRGHGHPCGVEQAAAAGQPRSPAAAELRRRGRRSRGGRARRGARRSRALKLSRAPRPWPACPAARFVALPTVQPRSRPPSASSGRCAPMSTRVNATSPTTTHPTTLAGRVR